MALTVTPSRRRIVMAVLLALAAGGTLVRYTAPNPSTLRDVGTLFMVMWLPAVGNLIAYLASKLPRGAPPPTGFPAGSVFTPQLSASIEPVASTADGVIDADDDHVRRWSERAALGHVSPARVAARSERASGQDCDGSRSSQAPIGSLPTRPDAPQ